jgi:hypothetical protein
MVLRAVKLVNFYVMKAAMLSCMVTALCIFLAGCVNVSLQLIFVIEQSYDTYGSAHAQRCMLFFAMPTTMLLWTMVTGYVLSRQGELIYAVYHLPYYSKESLEIAITQHSNAKMHMRLTGGLNSSTPEGEGEATPEGEGGEATPEDEAGDQSMGTEQDSITGGEEGISLAGIFQYGMQIATNAVKEIVQWRPFLRLLKPLKMCLLKPLELCLPIRRLRMRI